jgi:hypothetical protein
VDDNLLSSVRRALRSVLLVFTLYYLAALSGRHFVKFPMPHILAPAIDNPLRRQLP